MYQKNKDWEALLPEWLRIGARVKTRGSHEQRLGTILGISAPPKITLCRKDILVEVILDGERDRLTYDIEYLEPILPWSPRPGEVVIARKQIEPAVGGHVLVAEGKDYLFLRVSAGGTLCYLDGRLHTGIPTENQKWNITAVWPVIYRIPEGLPMDQFSDDPKWWDENAEKYTG